MAEDIIQEEHPEKKGRIYWFFRNIRTGISTGIRSWIKKHPILTTIAVLVLLYSAYTGRAGLQPVFLALRIYSILVLLALLVILLFMVAMRKRTAKKRILPTVLLILFLALCVFTGPAVHRYLSLYFHYAKLEKVMLQELPVSGNERLQPINSIRTLINQEALSETEDATDPRFVRGADGQYYFTSCVGPSRSYYVQRFTKDMYEMLQVPATLPSPVFTGKYRSKVHFEVGELLIFSKETEVAVTKKFSLMQYFNCETSEPVYLQNDRGQWVQVVPIIRWEGIFFPRPVFGGVYVVNQEGPGDNYFKRLFLGKGAFVSPEDILKTPYLQGQNLLPHEVVDYIANSFRFANGFLAPMPGYHEGDVRIPELAKDQNPMPFVTYLEMGKEKKLYNYYGLEPFEESKKGLSLSIFIPGDNDKTVYFINHRTEKYIGSSAVQAKIVESKKSYDWSVNYPAESRPYIREINGKRRFLWLSTVVSRAGDDGEYIGGSIPEICLTDAVYGKVIWIDQDSLMYPDAWQRTITGQMKSYWGSE